ncbi:putative Na+-dependent transporter [Sporomusaceae bacterium BoRhaA]|uniref:bile acid:sodium symporter family protein n=1 Tax=Pelorhabdus rhamnosifermentans TaxID=2772457 RepID=UPI001C060FBE|nr:bile acid:sodium symporter [Pelorhabdus rhamnosifermentans]MBU2701880.1 putative Na+-dependent transporter [Pelorhabdus rhamnosifermentans]
MSTAFFIRCNSLLGKNMLFIVLGGLLAGAFIPLTDSPVLRKTVIVLFAYMTFVTALGTSFKSFLDVLRKPWIPLWVLVLVHVMAPLTAWIVGIVFYPNDPFIRMGYLIGASIPIGVTSIIWISLAKGDLAISLVSVTLDTFVVPIVLPLFFNLVVGKTIGLNYVQMIEELMLMVTVPSVLGMLLHDWTEGKVTQFSSSVGGATSKLGLFIVIIINSAMVMPQIHWDLSIVKTLFVTFLVVAAGYFVGYIGSFLLKDHSPQSVLTMIYSVGMRNNACGLVVALTYFPPSVAIPITLSMLFQQPLASFIFSLNRRLN